MNVAFLCGIKALLTLEYIIRIGEWLPLVFPYFLLQRRLFSPERTALSKLEGRQRDLQQSVEALETDTMTITNTKDR